MWVLLGGDADLKHGYSILRQKTPFISTKRIMFERTSKEGEKKKKDGVGSNLGFFKLNRKWL